MKDWIQSIPLAQRGNQNAFHAIIREFQDMAVAYAYSILGDFQLAEDAAQEAFVQCYLSLPQLQNTQAFPAWFKQIVFRQCNRLTRNRHVPTVPVEYAEDAVVEERNPLQLVEQREVQDRVNAVIRELPAHEREVTALFYINGYSMSEVGAFLDVPVTTVKNRLHSARNKLREAMIGMVEDTLKQHTPDENFHKRLEEKLHWSRLWVTEIGCIKGCLDYMNIDVSIPWLMGGTGHAFVINIPDAVCSSGPTAWNKEPFYKLGENLGFRTDTIFAHISQPDFQERQKLAWDKVRRAIDKRQPCYGWQMDAPEFYVIHGYDERGYLFRKFDFTDGHKPWQELGNTEIGVAQVWILTPKEPADDTGVVRDALEYALEASKGGDDFIGPPSKLGLPGYDLWLHELEAGHADGFGLAYNSVCWTQCRHFAVEFLKEAGQRIGRNQKLWEEAETHYRVVYENLAQVSGLYPFDPGMIGVLQYDLSESTRHVAADRIRTARQAEEAGLQTIQKLVSHLR